jgi:hypothetical protein
MRKWIKAWRLRRMERKLAMLLADAEVLHRMVRSTHGHANWEYGHKMGRVLRKAAKLRVIIGEFSK